jgi:hypothetical protein
MVQIEGVRLRQEKSINFFTPVLMRLTGKEKSLPQINDGEQKICIRWSIINFYSKTFDQCQNLLKKMPFWLVSSYLK